MATNLGFNTQKNQIKQINPLYMTGGLKIGPNGQVIAPQPTLPTISQPQTPQISQNPAISTPSTPQTTYMPKPTNSNPIPPQIGAINNALGGISAGLQNLSSSLNKSKETVVPPRSPYADIKDALTKAMTVGPEEESAQTALSNLATSKELGLQDIQNKPIAIPFITGQQAAVERSAALREAPLKTKLATLQARRQAALDVAKTQYDISQKETEANKPIEINGSLVKLNPQTGQYESVYTGLKQATGDIAEYQQLYGKNPTPDEYKLFLKQKAEATAKPISETAQTLNALRDIMLQEKQVVPGQIVHSSSNTPVQLTDQQSQFFSMGSHLLTTANEIKNIVNNIGTDAIKGWVTEQGYLIPVVQNALDPQQQALMQKMYDMNNLFVYFSTGKQINETEFNRLARQTPNFRATPEYNNSAIDQFTSMINERMNNYLRVNGWKIYGGETTPQQTSGSTSQPQAFQLPDGSTVYLQADGTYQ